MPDQGYPYRDNGAAYLGICEIFSRKIHVDPPEMPYGLFYHTAWGLLFFLADKAVYTEWNFCCKRWKRIHNSEGISQ